MKKILIFLIVIAFLATVVDAGIVYDAEYYKKHITSFRTFARNDPMRRHLVEVNALLFPATGDATVWYVNSNVSTAGDGTSWTKAFNTLDEGINACAAGDFVDVAEAHAESGVAANLWDADVAGITIRHYGNGTRQGTYTFADIDTTVAVGAANVTIYGGRLLAGISEVVVGLIIDAAGKNFTAIGMEWPEPGTAEFEFNIGVQLTTASNDATFINCVAYSADQTGADHWLNGGTGVVHRLTLIGNVVVGEFAIAPIFSDQADIECYITNNVITQMTSGELGLEFTGNATGICRDNFVVSDAIGNSYDTGFMDGGGGLWADEDSSDTTPVPWTTNETGVNRWGASELAQIEGEATDSIEAAGLDHLIIATVADEIIDDSILADITTAGSDWSDFVASTDSLQAIADHVQTLITTGAGTDVYPSGVTNESIIAFLLAKGSTATASTYDNTTDSLEALSDAISAATTTLIPGRTYAVVNAEVDLQSANLFEVAGGPILISSFTGLVTETVAGAAETTKIIFDGVDDFEFSSAVDLTGIVRGARIIFTGVNAAVLTPLELGAVGSGNLMEPWFCPVGMIETVDGESNAQNGIVSWYMTFIPLTSGVTVTVQ